MSRPLSIAIVHYHLRGGGVTRVIEHALSALGDHPIQCAVLTGEAPDADSPIAPNTEVVEGLAYGHGEEEQFEPQQLYIRLKDAAKRKLGGEADLWHIHNHSLGKNAAATSAFLQLAREKPVLFQIHDFAEDGRPGNYLYLSNFLQDQMDELYPYGPHIHYALLNRRDQHHLQEAGLDQESIHLLENPVDLGLDDEFPEPAHPDFVPAGKKLILYPTRAIRRKNMGEMMLWAALSDGAHHFAATLAPKNPKQQPVYEAWKSFADDYELPVTFEAGLKWEGPFTQLLRSAEALITTSVAEGFGLAFLEPWLVNRPVIGRNLSSITSGFREAGVELPYLYDRLSVPTRWLDVGRLQADLGRHIETLFGNYGLDLEDERRDWMINQLTGGGHVDFAVLGESYQRTIIQHLLDHPADRKWLDPPKLLPDEFDLTLIEQNRKLIKEKYNLQAYGKRLYALYQKIAGQETTETGNLDPRRVLDQFLAPTEISMLRS